VTIVSRSLGLGNANKSDLQMSKMWPDGFREGIESISSSNGTRSVWRNIDRQTSQKIVHAMKPFKPQWYVSTGFAGDGSNRMTIKTKDQGRILILVMDDRPAVGDSAMIEFEECELDRLVYK
jgi:hypothetical protein